MGEVTEISEYDFFVTVLSETVRRGGQAKKSTELTKVLFFCVLNTVLDMAKPIA